MKLNYSAKALFPCFFVLVRFIGHGITISFVFMSLFTNRLLGSHNLAG